MPNHMLMMSFDHSSLKNLLLSLNRFFEYTVAMFEENKLIKFTYIGTAANDRLFEGMFFALFVRLKFGPRMQVTRLLLTGDIGEQKIEKHISEQDIIYVGGGNTEIMLNTWHNKGFTSVLNRLRREDRLPLLAGVSAGGMYPFHSGLSDSTPGHYRVLKCLDWLKHSFCAHADSKKQAICEFDDNKKIERLSAYQSAIKKGVLPPGYAVPNHCMLHFYDDELVKALTVHEKHQCLYITPESAQPIETIHLTRNNVDWTAQDVLYNLQIPRIKAA